MDDPKPTARQIADDLNSRGGWRKASPRKSQGYMAICPNHNDKNPSLSVRETENGRILLHCFATTCTDDRAVYDAVERKLGKAPGSLGGPGAGYEPAARLDDGVKGARKEFEPIVPVPADAPKFSLSSRRFRSKAHGAPACFWTYRNAEGKPMGYVARYETKDADGKVVDKMIWPWTFALREGRREWVVGAMPDPRTLYNLDLIAASPDAVVQLHEGEKSADAGGIIFPNWIPTTTVGGGSAPHLTDFTPLKGRTVIICHDNDAAGVVYAQQVSALLIEAGAIPRMLRFPTAYIVKEGALEKSPYAMDPGDDMADHMRRGWTTELVREAITLSGVPLTWAIDDWEDERASQPDA